MELAAGDEDKLGVAIESQADARACRRWRRCAGELFGHAAERDDCERVSQASDLRSFSPLEVPTLWVPSAKCYLSVLVTLIFFNCTKSPPSNTLRVSRKDGLRTLKLHLSGIISFVSIIIICIIIVLVIFGISHVWAVIFVDDTTNKTNGLLDRWSRLTDPEFGTV